MFLKNNLKKILIISYFFPPCNLTASQRALGWAKYLHKFGYKPIIVTRNWDLPIITTQDISQPSGKEIIHKQNEDYEVYYIPYIGNKRDRIYAKYGDSKKVYYRRILTFLEKILQNFSIRYIAYKNMFDFTKQYLHKNPDIKLIVITANPFSIFSFGYLLHKKFGINWIADYRDDWSTDDLKKNKSFVERLISKFERKSEKKWVGTAAKVTSVSDHYVEKISHFTGIQGEVLYNGFFEEDFEPEQKIFYDEVTFTYNGTLYPSQHIEMFLEGFKKAHQILIKKGISIRLYFPGLSFKKDQALRVKTLLKGYENYLTITDRIPRSQVLEIQKKSHAVLMFPHSGIKGIPSSKLYEYLGLNKFILLCPSDNDIIEQTIRETGNGIICNSVEDVRNFIIDFSMNPNRFISQLVYSKNLKYSRKEQTKKLTEVLNSIVK